MAEKTRTNITALVKAAGTGNKDALASLYKETSPALRAVCARYFQHDYDIDDAVREVYVRIFRELPALDAPKQFAVWSRDIARDVCLNRIRSRNLISDKQTEAPTYTDLAAAASDTRTAADYRSTHPVKNGRAGSKAGTSALILTTCLAPLTDVQRSCLLLWADGYDEKTAAQRLGLPVVTVENTLGFARQKLTSSIRKLESDHKIRLNGMDPLSYFLELLDQAGAGGVSGAGSHEPSASDPAVLTSVMEELAAADAAAEAASSQAVEEWQLPPSALRAATSLGEGGIYTCIHLQKAPSLRELSAKLTEGV